VVAAYAFTTYLPELKNTGKHKVMSATEFMGLEPLFLNARLHEFYEQMPVPENWHEGYRRGRT